MTFTDYAERTERGTPSQGRDLYLGELWTYTCDAQYGRGIYKRQVLVPVPLQQGREIRILETLESNIRYAKS